MLVPQFSTYPKEVSGEDSENIYFSSSDFFCVLTGGELPKEKGKKLLEEVFLKIENTSITRLHEFDQLLGNMFTKTDLPAHFSFSGGFLKGDVLFLKTAGSGKVYLQRGRDFVKIVDQNKSASGYVKPQDLFFITFDEAVSSRELRSYLLVSFQKEKSSETQALLEKIKYRLQQYTRGKIATFGLLILVFLIFVWSVLSGYQNKLFSSKAKKIEIVRELISEKLSQAEDVAFLNQSRAVALIGEAKKDLTDLKKQIKDENNKEILSLEQLIRDKEARIFKTEEKRAEEYFDLSIEEKGAKGIRMYIDEGSLTVLDPSGFAYLLSLNKKSIEKRKSSSMKNASFIALSQNDVFFYKTDGVYKISSDGKTKKVIVRDKDWKNIIDMVFYNKNMYLLDKGRDQVYKYLVSQDGFSQKTPYLKSTEKPDFSNAISLAIDSSVYISLPGAILKYTAGVRDAFPETFPQEKIQITKVIARDDLEKVFAWVKKRGALFILSKEGAYESETTSPVLKTATDVSVFKGSAYALSGAKIFKIPLD